MSESDRVYRFGIVGAGMIAAVHRDAIEALPNAVLTGVMDNGSGRGMSLAPGSDRTGSDDIEAFVARDDIDVITVASPSGAHLEAALAATTLVMNGKPRWPIRRGAVNKKP